MTVVDSSVVCRHYARDVGNTGGGEVVRQISQHMIAAGMRVEIVSDTPAHLIDVPGARVINTPLGGRLLAWRPRTRAGWLTRHFTQIAAYTVFSSLVPGPRGRFRVSFNHNCESLRGNVLVMHNVFTAELRRRELGVFGTARALVNPVRASRIAKELFLSRPSARRHLVAVSEAAAHEVVSLAGSPRRVTMIENGVDVQHFSVDGGATIPPKLRDWATENSINRIVLFVGHEYQRKGLQDLIVALSGLPSEVGLCVVGGASQNQEYYRQLANDIAATNRVFYAGEATDVRPYYAHCDVFCLPSYYETMGLVGLEALACGVPIVVTEDTPLARLIRPGVNGSTCTHDPQNIAMAITDALEIACDGDRAEVRSTVLSHGWENASVGYLELALEVVRNRPTL